MTDGLFRRTPILDGRLSAAMALAEGTQVFADIGADHGRLSAVMLLSGARHALVADISAAALEKARRRLHALDLDSRVTFAVADGLAALDMLKHAPDTVFVLGMGGETICGILRRGRARLGGAALILGAQTDLPMVRRTVCEVGYRIRREVIASAGGRDYVLMRCTPALAGEAAYTECECILGPGLLRAPSPEWRHMLERRMRLLGQEITAMEKAGLEKDRERLAMNRRELGYVTGQLRRMQTPGAEGGDAP